MPRLLVSPEGGDPYLVPLPASPIIIGRSLTSFIVLSDKCCSGRHATIVPTGAGYAIQDLNSKNGTAVNDESIHQRTDLRIGDTVRIGSTLLRFERDPDRDGPAEPGTTADRSGTVIKDVREFLNATPPPTWPARPGSRPAASLRAPDREDAIIMEAVNQALVYSDGQLDRYLDRIMDVITEHIPMDRGILMLEGALPGELVPRVTKLRDPAGEAAGLPTSRGIVLQAFEDNQAVLIPDTQELPPSRRADSIIKAHIHSAMCAPLYDYHDIIGVVYADRISRRDPFDETDLRRLIFLANLVADKIQLDRRRREHIEDEKIKIEVEQARRYQRYLLPKADPDFEPFDISGREETSPTVGGDYFDYVPLGPDRLGLVIADVAGTGIPASLKMSGLSSALWTEARRSGDLGELAARLNETVFSKTEAHEFISFFMGVVDRAAGEMIYVNAGHNYPLLLEPAGRVQPLASTGTCLGMFPCSSYETRTVPIRPGQILCLYTDGIVEHRNAAREQFGEARLVESLKGSGHLPARELLDRVYEAVRSFAPGAVAEDDMTMVVLKRKPG